MRRNNQIGIDLAELETTLTRIMGPLDKLQLESSKNSVPAKDAVSAFLDASQKVESVKHGDIQEKTQALELVDAKLEVAEQVVNGLNEREIRDSKMDSFKQQVFENYGRNSRSGLPDSFAHLNNMPVKKIIPKLRQEIQREIN